MKRFLAATLMAFFLPAVAYGQGNTAVLFDAAALIGKAHIIRDEAEISGTESGQAVFPGVELRLGQGGRVTFGVSYQRWELGGEPERERVTLSQTISNGMVVSEQGFEYTSEKESSLDTVLASVYVNLLTEGKVRPFLGFGGGVNFDNTKTFYSDVVEWKDPPGSSDGFPISPFEQQSGVATKHVTPAIKAVAGVNVFPAEHLVLSIGGGYINGPVASFGVGATF